VALPRLYVVLIVSGLILAANCLNHFAAFAPDAAALGFNDW